MSVLSDLEDVRRQIGEQEYQFVNLFLKCNEKYRMDQVFYKKEIWDKFQEWKKKKSKLDFSKIKFVKMDNEDIPLRLFFTYELPEVDVPLLHTLLTGIDDPYNELVTVFIDIEDGFTMELHILFSNGEKESCFECFLDPNTTETLLFDSKVEEKFLEKIREKGECGLEVLANIKHLQFLAGQWKDD